MERKWWLAEETYRRKVFGIKILDDQQFNKLRTAKCRLGNNEICEAFSYNILTNPAYQAVLSYRHARLRYYETDVKSDRVTELLFAAYKIRHDVNFKSRETINIKLAASRQNSLNFDDYIQESKRLNSINPDEFLE